jgi:MFS family permease
MLHIIRHHLKKRQYTFLVLLVFSFFFSAQVALTIYIDSSFLSETISKSVLIGDGSIWKDPDNLVGAIYTISSLFTILALMVVPTILRRIGNYRATLAAVILHMLGLLGLGLSDSAWLIIPMFIIANTLTSVLYFNLDIFLERYSKDEDTGKIRGMFMSFSSIAWLLPPLFAGYIVEAKGFQMVYLCAALLIFPIIILVMRFLNHFKDMAYDEVSLLMTHEEVVHNKDIHNALAVNTFLHLFYSWMIIYVPIYLHNIGISWDQIGLMLTIALSVFIILPYPIGYLADKYYGEKEFLVGGFVLMAATSAIIPLLGASSAPFWLWALTLFLGRAGACTAETMSETYYFKKIDGRNAQLIGYFRRTRPLAYVIAPITASILLESGVVSIAQLFYLLAALMIVALHFVSELKDTK